MLGHNGEINTLLGNLNWAAARAASLPTCSPTDTASLLCDVRSGPTGRPAAPLVDNRKSDSGNLDSVLESYVRADYSPTEAIMVLAPEAYRGNPTWNDNDDVAAFYEFHAPMQESWDGPVSPQPLYNC